MMARQKTNGVIEMAATVYVVKTNGVEDARMTNKVKAIARAEELTVVADERKAGDIIQVVTAKTGKEIYWHVAVKEKEYSPCGHWVGLLYSEGSCSRCIFEAALRGDVDHSMGEEVTDTMEEPQMDAEGVMNAIAADWERELNATGTIAVSVPVMCQDCLTNEATIFDMDAPSCDECERKYTAMNETPKTDTVCVVQAWAGSVGVNHYHAPGCRDIQREAKRWNASEDMGISSNAFSSVAEIISHEYSDICEDVAEMLSEANGDYAGIRIMPCLSIPFGDLDSRPLSLVNGVWTLGEAVEDSETSYEVDSHTRYPHGRKGPEDTTAETEVFEPGTRVIHAVTGERGTVVQPYMTGVIYGIGERMPAVTVEMDNGSMQNALIGDLMLKFQCKSENGKAVHVAPCAEATGEDGACCEYEDENTYGPWIDPECGCERHANPSEVPCPDHAGRMITREYDLSVIVDESTGATVSLGWITLTLPLNGSWQNWDAVAEEYGRVHGKGTPRHGWASIIIVHDAADQF